VAVQDQARVALRRALLLCAAIWLTSFGLAACGDDVGDNDSGTTNDTTHAVDTPQDSIYTTVVTGVESSYECIIREDWQGDQMECP
jgi:hypothetical protein